MVLKDFCSLVRSILDFFLIGVRTALDSLMYPVSPASPRHPDEDHTPGVPGDAGMGGHTTLMAASDTELRDRITRRNT
jgi:hypothetical protein